MVQKYFPYEKRAIIPAWWRGEQGSGKEFGDFFIFSSFLVEFTEDIVWSVK